MLILRLFFFAATFDDNVMHCQSDTRKGLRWLLHKLHKKFFPSFKQNPVFLEVSQIHWQETTFFKV